MFNFYNSYPAIIKNKLLIFTYYITEEIIKVIKKDNIGREYSIEGAIPLSVESVYNNFKTLLSDKKLTEFMILCILFRSFSNRNEFSNFNVLIKILAFQTEKPYENDSIEFREITDGFYSKFKGDLNNFSIESLQDLDIKDLNKGIPSIELLKILDINESISMLKSEELINNIVEIEQKEEIMSPDEEISTANYIIKNRHRFLSKKREEVFKKQIYDNALLILKDLNLEHKQKEIYKKRINLILDIYFGFYTGNISEFRKFDLYSAFFVNISLETFQLNELSLKDMLKSSHFEYLHTRDNTLKRSFIVNLNKYLLLRINLKFDYGTINSNGVCSDPNCQSYMPIYLLPIYEFHHEKLNSQDPNYISPHLILNKPFLKAKKTLESQDGGIIYLCRNCHNLKRSIHYSNFKNLIHKPDLFELIPIQIEELVYKSIDDDIHNYERDNLRNDIFALIKKRSLIEQVYGKNYTCIGCGKINIDKNLVAFIFHHFFSDIKEKKIGELFYKNLSIKEIAQIIKKENCVCLCRCCHTMIHSDNFINISKAIFIYLNRSYVKKIEKYYNDLESNIERQLNLLKKLDITNLYDPLNSMGFYNPDELWKFQLICMYHISNFLKKNNRFTKSELKFALNYSDAEDSSWFSKRIKYFLERGYIFQESFSLRYGLLENGIRTSESLIEFYMKNHAEDFKYFLKNIQLLSSSENKELGVIKGNYNRILYYGYLITHFINKNEFNSLELTFLLPHSENEYINEILRDLLKKELIFRYDAKINNSLFQFGLTDSGKILSTKIDKFLKDSLNFGFEKIYNNLKRRFLRYYLKSSMFIEEWEKRLLSNYRLYLKSNKEPISYKDWSENLCIKYMKKLYITELIEAGLIINVEYKKEYNFHPNTKLYKPTEKGIEIANKIAQVYDYCLKELQKLIDITKKNKILHFDFIREGSF